MGNFYTSAHIRTENPAAARAAIAAAAQELRFRCWVAPNDGAWLTFYPNDKAPISAIARLVTRKISDDVVLTGVHDSDVFCYSLFRGGEEVAEFASNPDYFSSVPAAVRLRARGDPTKITPLLAAPHTSDELDGWYARRVDFGPETLMIQFLELLGIGRGCSSYAYLERGEQDEKGGSAKFEHFPDLAAEKNAAKAARDRVRDVKQQLMRDGVLVFDSTVGRGRNAWQDMRVLGPHPAGGFVCSFYGDGRLQHWRPPEPPVPLDFGAGLRRWGEIGLVDEARMLAETESGPAVINLVEKTATPCPGAEHGVLVTLDDAGGIALFMGASELVAESFPGRKKKFRVPIGYHAQKFRRHPRLPHWVWSNQRELGIVDLETGRIIVRLGLFNRLIREKKEAQWRAVGIAPDLRFELEREDFLTLEFDATGESLFAGTDQGLRIYRYADVLAASERMPDPVFLYETSVALQDFRWVHSIVFAPAHQAAIFTCGNDSLRALDLPSLTVRELQPSIDRAMLFSVTRSGDLLAGFRRGYMEMPRREDEFSHQVWSCAGLFGRLNTPTPA